MISWTDVLRDQLDLTNLVHYDFQNPPHPPHAFAVTFGSYTNPTACFVDSSTTNIRQRKQHTGSTHTGSSCIVVASLGPRQNPDRTVIPRSVVCRGKILCLDQTSPDPPVRFFSSIICRRIRVQPSYLSQLQTSSRLPYKFFDACKKRGKKKYIWYSFSTPSVHEG